MGIPRDAGSVKTVGPVSAPQGGPRPHRNRDKAFNEVIGEIRVLNSAGQDPDGFVIEVNPLLD